MIKEIIKELMENNQFYTNLVISHMEITLIAAVIATIFGVAIGVFISEKRSLANSIIAFINVAYTIPSIAMLGFLISITGIGNTTAVIALIIYGLLPIVRSTYTGLTSVDSRIVEASEAMGSTRWQTLYKIKLPLAMPIIFSAIRNMMTMTIALAGIASFVGAGGLGVAIYRGITTNNDPLILIGSGLIALLAIIVDIVLSIVEYFVIKGRRTNSKRQRNTLISLLVCMGILGAGYTIYHNNQAPQQEIVIASKPTSEGYILGEMASLLIKEKTGLPVRLVNGVGGGTSNIHPGMVKGDFDLYPEYTGTAWQIVLKEPEQYSDKDFPRLQELYKEKYKFVWKGMLGFNNTYSLAMPKEIAEKYHIKTFSDLAKYPNKFVFGAEYDFFEREDGFKALAKAYNLKFKKQVDMDNGLKYQALFDKKIQVMTVFTTDGQLDDPRITVLQDDLGFYPKYMAGFVVREATLQEYPQLEGVLSELNGLIDEKTMAKLNRQVEIDKENPREVARQFLISKGLLESKDGK